MKTEPHETYDPAYFAPLFKAEEGHFWFRARNRILQTLVSQVVKGLPPGYRVLDLGCGTGGVLRALEPVCRDGVLIGMDLFPDALTLARRRVACELVQGDVHHPPFTQPFDLIGSFDVLEHLDDDVGVLRSMHKMLAPGGALLLTVPAHMSLWSRLDEVGHHCRRYEPGELEGRLGECGFSVEHSTQFMASIFPLVWLSRRLANWKANRSKQGDQIASGIATDELRIVPVFNEVLTAMLLLESRFIARRWRLPLGTSILALARKN
jgi:SAM-dependent methyltransferase